MCSGVVERQAIYRLQGDRIDRILAQAGQKVTCKQGKSADRRTAVAVAAAQFRCNCPTGWTSPSPDGHYFIFPSTDLLPPTLPVWQAASIVPRGQILGRVYWRTSRCGGSAHPLNRTS